MGKEAREISTEAGRIQQDDEMLLKCRQGCFRRIIMENKGLGHHTTLLTMQLDKIIRFLSTIFPFMNVSLFLDSYFKFVVNHVISIYHGASTQWKLKLGNFTSPPMWEREF